jgi:SAM-dependent methyltransferase
MSKEYESSQYDAIYASGGAEDVYRLPYRHSSYYPLHREMWHEVRRRGARSVLEVGCGTGAFAQLLADLSPDIAYRGFDFSPVAVDQAIARTGTADRLFVGDAREAGCYRSEFDTIVCSEVLEHIDGDLDVVARWPAGTWCVCSVPNFDADNHLRHFLTDEQVRQRYGSLIDIERIRRVKKPFLSDLSVPSYWRALRWNRYRPRRLALILGLASFEKLGGWFVFSGPRNAARH